MKKIVLIITFSTLLLSTILLQAEDLETPQNDLSFELESQLPCFFNGGYQASAGIHYDNLRFRLSVMNSGTADFEESGIDRIASDFERSFSDGSIGFLVDYYLTKCLFVTGAISFNRWEIRSNNSDGKDYMQTLDAGLGLGFQYFVYKGLFLQLSCQINARQQKSLIIESEEYTIPQMEWIPGLRLGYRF
ncbi:hypothetical protein [Oceanispirochaeta sp.]|uniref:hypothetical protein n=1 Tax=Oceanispirochaeta sp. TaxID=2035350 RepID=UPI002618E3AA|nr:hypothetical protein [Oceanispirochaeta sp.]MDA3957769.1 hypothetical protein [Oceanispirochaeta sp.]